MRQTAPVSPRNEPIRPNRPPPESPGHRPTPRDTTFGSVADAGCFVMVPQLAGHAPCNISTEHPHPDPTSCRCCGDCHGGLASITGAPVRQSVPPACRWRGRRYFHILLYSAPKTQSTGLPCFLGPAQRSRQRRSTGGLGPGTDPRATLFRHHLGGGRTGRGRWLLGPIGVRFFARVSTRFMPYSANDDALRSESP